MTEPLIRLLDSVRIDENRQYIEFRFKDGGGEEQAIQIDFEYVELLAALFQQAFVSAVMACATGRQSLARTRVCCPCRGSTSTIRSALRLI